MALSYARRMIRYDGPRPEGRPLRLARYDCDAPREGADGGRTRGNGRVQPVTAAVLTGLTWDRMETARYADGVYVDVSWRDGGPVVVAVCAVRDYKSLVVTFAAAVLGDTNAAEREAVAVARDLFPDMPVYVDHRDAANGRNVHYVPRTRNGLAHRAARNRTNYRPRQ